MKPHSLRVDALRRSFWIIAVIGLVVGLGLGLLVPSIDRWTGIDVPVIELGRSEAGSLMQAIATVSMSVAGVSFSVTVVALQLASQQLSPRVLRTFQTDWLSKTVLAVFLGTFAYSAVVLARLGAVPHPELTIAGAVVAAVVSLAFFAVFIQDIVVALQASNLIKRIAADGVHTVERRYPDDIGSDPDDVEEAWAQARRRMAGSDPIEVRAPRAGYLTAVDPEILMAPPGAGDSLIRQCSQIGDFVVTGALLAQAWCQNAPEHLHERLAGAFRIQHERSVVQDIAFPIRQLADVALRSISPALNDPTTAENAMGSVADTLVRYARRGDGVPVRVDGDGRPRFVAHAPDLNDLVRLGFDQVRVQAAPYPTLSVRLLALLAEIRRAAEAVGTDCREAVRQAELLGDAVSDSVPTRSDVETVLAARDRALDGT